MSAEFLSLLTQWLDSHHVPAILRSFLLLVVGIPALRLLTRLLQRVVHRRLTEQGSMVLGKAVFYTGVGILILMVMRELDFKVATILGAAGVVGVAFGFAAQTSLSNLISGLFLIGEESFAVGDVITLGDISGTVMSIDLLSIKIRTFDNRFVRIPNETLIKSQMTNVTRFRIRRLDTKIGVAYREDPARVIAILKDVADLHPLCLDEPEPLVVFERFGDSALEFMLGVWFAKEDYLDLRNSLLIAIKERFDREGVQIPYPHRSIEFVNGLPDPSALDRPGSPSETR